MILKAILLFVVLLAGQAWAGGAFSGRVSQVTDGDTLWVVPDSGGAARKLRIDGIDAPEICQAGGAESRAELTRLALNRHVSVVVRRRDHYGRGLARIQLDSSDLGRQMVRLGQAWSYRWQRDLGPYAVEEQAARQARLGLFASSTAVVPRDFRKRHGSCHVAR
jgi:endonuclease YncB( thermonuclease family)